MGIKNTFKKIIIILIALIVCTNLPLNTYANTKSMDTVERNYENSISKVNQDILTENTVTMNLQEYYSYKEKSIRTFSITGSVTDEKKKMMKDKLFQGINNYQISVDLSEYCTDIDYNDSNITDIIALYFDLIYEKPQLFYVQSRVAISWSYDQNTNKFTGLRISILYQYPKEEIIAKQSIFNNKIEEIKKIYLKDISDKLQLEYIIHDYIVNNTAYDYDNYLNGTISQESYTAYGTLINGQAVCDGYSKATKLLLDLVGIESGVITSEAMNHAWNYVKINGQYYHLDTTWDDPVPDTKRNRYDFFNLSDEEISQNHQWVKGDYPACTDNSFRFLRDLGSYNTARVGSRIYLNNYQESSLFSVSLLGQDIKLEVPNTYGNYLTPYKNSLIYLNGNNIYRLDVNSKEEILLKECLYYPNNLYIIGDILYVELDNEIVQVNLKVNGDLNDDGKFDISDISVLALSYNSNSTSLGWDSKFDLNKDGVIDIYDIVYLSYKI